jgi:hypothetical protein
MNTIKQYGLAILCVIFGTIAFLNYARFKGRELEIEQLSRDNENLRQHIITLDEKITLLDSYPYEHSEIKKENNDRVTDFPKHNDFGNCTKYRQCGCTCGDGKGVTKRPAKKGADLRDSGSIPF